MLEILLVLVVLAAVVLIVSGPLRRARPELPKARDEVAELEAARDAKYREIRDAELDYQTGKLSAADFAAIDSTLRAAQEAKYREIRDAELDREMGKLSRDDWREVDRELRGEAIEILRELDRLEGRPPG